MDASNLSSVRRGVAIFLGAFSLLNALASIFNPGFDANGWWIDLRLLPRVVVVALLGLNGVLLVGFAIRPQLGRLRRIATVVILVFLAIAALINSGFVLWILLRGRVRSDFPVPFSLLVLAAILFVGIPIFKNENLSKPRRAELWIVVTAMVCAVVFPVAQMFTFGLSDYRRPVDAVVVFGARTYGDGTPSEALADRVRTACEIYHQENARWLILSGGPGDGAVYEADAMRTLAISLGVPDRSIVRDDDGLTTASTVADTVPILARLGARRVLAVSHYYHLPRVKLSYSPAGLDVLTAPARQSHMLPGMPRLMAREVVGIWEYYLDPLLPKGVRMRS